MARSGSIVLKLASLVVVAAFGVFAWQQVERSALPERQVSASGLAQLQGTQLPDSGGTPRAIASWSGKVLVVNFWATWCPPCRKEMPAFSRINEKMAANGVQFVGIGIDSPSAIREFAIQAPVSYPLLIGGSEGMELVRALGNAAASLPYTVILDRSGRVALTRLGMIEEDEFEQLLRRLASPAPGDDVARKS